MAFVATMNSTVIGGLTIVLHGYYSVKPIAYIYDIGVRPDFQRKGIGKALINEVCNFGKERGFEDAYVEAESGDIDAVEFYRRTNFSREMNATHFTYTFDDEKQTR